MTERSDFNDKPRWSPDGRSEKGTRTIMTVILRATIPFFLLFIAPALLLSCPERSSSPDNKADARSVRLNQEFSIRVGQQVTVQGEKLKVKLVSVANDSRCPRDVKCVWAGNAEVMIHAETKGKSADLKLNTSGAENFPKEVSHQGYKFTLVALSPLPSKDKAIKPADYSATIVIRKE